MVHYEYIIFYRCNVKCVFYGWNEEDVVWYCWRKEGKSNNKHPVSVKYHHTQILVKHLQTKDVYSHFLFFFVRIAHFVYTMIDYISNDNSLYTLKIWEIQSLLSAFTCISYHFI